MKCKAHHGLISPWWALCFIHGQTDMAADLAESPIVRLIRTHGQLARFDHGHPPESVGSRARLRGDRGHERSGPAGDIAALERHLGYQHPT